MFGSSLTGRPSLVASLHNLSATSDVARIAIVLLHLFERDVVPQPNFVGVEFDNHEIFAINYLGPSAMVLPNTENQTVDFHLAPVPAFLHSVRSVAVPLHCLHV